MCFFVVMCVIFFDFDFIMFFSFFAQDLVGFG